MRARPLGERRPDLVRDAATVLGITADSVMRGEVHRRRADEHDREVPDLLRLAQGGGLEDVDAGVDLADGALVVVQGGGVGVAGGGGAVERRFTVAGSMTPFSYKPQ